MVRLHLRNGSELCSMISLLPTLLLELGEELNSKDQEILLMLSVAWMHQSVLSPIEKRI